MNRFSFLPHFPIENWQLIVFAILLLFGYATGELLRRLRLPRLLGYLLIGVLLGDMGLGVVNLSVREDMALFIDVGLGLLLYELGQRLDLQWMRRERWLWILAISEMLLTWLFGFTILTLFDFSRLEAALLAAVVMSTSPLVAMYTVRDLVAEGQVTGRVLTLSALNSMVAFMLSAMLLSWLRYEYQGGMRDLLLHPLYLLVGSFLLSVLVFILFRTFARWFGKNDAPQFVLTIAMILLGVGLAHALKLSVLTTMLALGVLAKNADPQRRIRHIEFGVASELFYVVLFISAGAALKFTLDSSILWIAVSLIAVRYLGKAIAVYGVSAFTPLGLSRAGLLTLALTPLSGFTALLVLDGNQQSFKAPLLAVFLTMVAILEFVGPILVQFALRRAKETRPET